VASRIQPGARSGGRAWSPGGAGDIAAALEASPADGAFSGTLAQFCRKGCVRYIRALAPRCLRVLAPGNREAVLAAGLALPVAAGACWRARADTAVSHANPVMMPARWNSPPSGASLVDWPKPAAASVMAAGMVTAVAAL
jgi:hypothetical protein